MSDGERLSVGCIGLGIMGRPMALNVVRAGFPVVAWNRSNNARFQEVLEAGSERAGSPREVAERAEVIVVNVTDSPDVEQVILGDHGVIQGARAGAVVVDNSTISPD